MTRCNFSRRRSATVLLATLAMTLGLTQTSAWALANPRPFPPNVERAVLTVQQPPIVLINGKPDRLSPGARIRGANNMQVMSGALVGQAMVVNFVREPNGQIHEVWILTAAEARQPVASAP